MSLIIEYPNAISEAVCEDIVEKIDSSKTTMPIPKNDPEWNRAERLLYKTVLVHLMQYKLQILESNPALTKELGKKLKLDEFTIHKVSSSPCFRPPSRKHVVTFVLFLSQSENGELKFKNKIVTSEMGKLVFFPDDIDHIYTINEQSNEYWVISNQISTL
jgi:hypothetical protein